MTEKEHTNGSFVQPAISCFDGFYDHWLVLMENLLHSKEYWEVVENGVPSVEVNASQEVKKVADEAKLKDLKAKNYLFQALDRNVLETILKMDSANDIWDLLKQKFQGSSKVKKSQLQVLRGEFEALRMKDGETVNEYFSRNLTIVNKMKGFDEKITETTVVEKILRSMTHNFNYVACSIVQSRDIEKMSIDDLQSSLIVEEQHMKGY